MFDDDSKGLVREPFVCGIPQMMDLLVADVPDAEKGFALYFSAQPFPACQLRVDLIGPEAGGNWYNLTFNGNVMKKDVSFYEAYAKVNYTINDNWAVGLNEWYSLNFLNNWIMTRTLDGWHHRGQPSHGR